jgi:hypothetical protein
MEEMGFSFGGGIRFGSTGEWMRWKGETKMRNQRLNEIAFDLDGAAGKLANAFMQSESDVVPCDVRLSRALDMLLVARAYARALRASGMEGDREMEIAQEAIDEAAEECERQYDLRR